MLHVLWTCSFMQSPHPLKACNTQLNRPMICKSSNAVMTYRIRITNNVNLCRSQKETYCLEVGPVSIATKSIFYWIHLILVIKSFFVLTQFRF